MKDPFDVEPIRGTGLVVSTALEVAGQLPRPSVVNEPRVTLTDGVLCADQDDRDVRNVSVVLRHLGVVRVDGVEAHLVLQTEDKNDCIDPVCELQRHPDTNTRGSVLLQKGGGQLNNPKVRYRSPKI